MIYCYIFLALAIIFIYLLYVSYTISYLPLFMQNELIRSGEGEDIVEFIKLQDLEYEYQAKLIQQNAELISLNNLIANYNNKIDVQESTIESLKDLLEQLSQTLEEQENITDRKFFINVVFQPIVSFVLIEQQIKKYIYSKMKSDINAISNVILLEIEQEQTDEDEEVDV